jgi:high-affinity K+ transport system ATPase subunit B
VLVIALWLWFTVLFANFAEAMAEGRGKAQGEPAQEQAGCAGKKAGSARALGIGRR